MFLRINRNLTSFDSLRFLAPLLACALFFGLYCSGSPIWLSRVWLQTELDNTKFNYQFIVTICIKSHIREIIFHRGIIKIELSKICPVVLFQSIRAKIRELNSGLFDHLHQTKTLKLQQLIGPQITDDTTLHSHNTVVTIPENLPLTDSEKSVLSKGVNFVPITKHTNKFSIKQDVEKFLRGVPLKAFFHDK